MHHILAMHKYRLVSSSPLDLGHLLNAIHYCSQVGALSIWCPAGDVELGHLVGLVGLEESVKERNVKGSEENETEGGKEEEEEEERDPS